MKKKDINYDSSVDRVFDEHRKKLELKRFHQSKRRIFFFSCLMGLIVSLIFYFMMDSSRTKGIKITGNTLLSDELIQKSSGLNEDTRLFLALDFIIENRLKKIELIESTELVKTNNGIIEIIITEKELVGYRYLNKPEILTKTGELIEMSDEYTFLLSRIPLINGFENTEDVDMIKELAKAFKNIDQKRIEQIAEIHQISYSYDEYGILCIMQDGNRIYGSLYSMDMLNSYNEVASALPDKRSCIYIDEMSGNPYTSLCPEEIEALEEAEKENIDEKSE